jgi:CDP-paratose 2-epimerase
MGKVDQGVFTYWMLAHMFGGPLSYLGFGGAGKQVRDLVHVDDVVDLVAEQLSEPERWHGATVNAGGGRDVSLSLRETTALCAEITGNTVDVVEDGSDRPGDIPIYISDNSRLAGVSGWQPRRSARDVLQDTCEWIAANEGAVKAALR